MPDNVVVLDLAERDEQVFSLRLAGKSVRSIARTFRISMKEVDDIVDASITPVTPREKLRIYELENHRIDQLQLAAYPQALKGNISAILACAKLMERRAAMIGIDAPTRIDPVQVVAQTTPVTTTDKIQLVLNELAERKQLPHPKLEIESEDGPGTS